MYTVYILPAKVRCVILCGNCGKPRCVYSAATLNQDQRTALDRLQDELLYSCGDSLFPKGDALHSIIIAREVQNCSSPIEIPYYSGILKSFLDTQTHTHTFALILKQQEQQPQHIKQCIKTKQLQH